MNTNRAQKPKFETLVGAGVGQQVTANGRPAVIIQVGNAYATVEYSDKTTEYMTSREFRTGVVTLR
jgi:prefoldin subunit 5